MKICGITDAAFAVEAARRGVDYLGLIFAAKSPRCVTVERARDIIATVTQCREAHPLDGKNRPGDSCRPRFVGVFVEQETSEILKIAKDVPLDVIQLHRNALKEEIETLKAAGFEVWRLAGADGEDDDFAGEDAVLLDGRDGARTGGTGRRADWSRVAELKRAGRRVVLAGGLSAANIAKAAATGADILDVNSALETSPGRKSVRLLDELLRP